VLTLWENSTCIQIDWPTNIFIFSQALYCIKYKEYSILNLMLSPNCCLYWILAITLSIYHRMVIIYSCDIWYNQNWTNSQMLHNKVRYDYLSALIHMHMYCKLLAKPRRIITFTYRCFWSFDIILNIHFLLRRRLTEILYAIVKCYFHLYTSKPSYKTDFSKNTFYSNLMALSFMRYIRN